MFSLYTRLAAIAVAATFLAGTHWKAYSSGKAAIRLEWQADVAQRTAEALQASERARKKEQELSAKVGRVDRAYQDQKRATQHVARAAADGLRNLEAILSATAVASSSAVATSGNHGAGGLERELLGNCAAALAELGKTADRLENKVVALQAYILATRANP